MNDQPRRRPRYKGTHPRRFEEKYKELDPQRFGEHQQKVMERGHTPAGTHRSIMVGEILERLAPQPGQHFLDATLGFGGHSRALLERLLPGGHLLGLDVDPLEMPRTEARMRELGFGPECFSARRMNFAGLTALVGEAIGDQEGHILLRSSRQQVQEGDRLRDFSGQPIPAGAYALLEVQDSGCGMPKDILSRIFEPFYSTKFSGRGLGLSAMLGILRGHHAAVQVDSRPGEGTHFRIYFPTSERTALREREKQPHSQDDLTPGLILLVDDEPVLRGATSEMLEFLGHRVLEARDGLEALEIFKAHPEPIDLVLMDLTMPRMDGREALKAMLSHDPSARVVLCSGFNEQEAVQGAEATTLAGFLAKPYRMQELRSIVNGVLSRRAES